MAASLWAVTVSVLPVMSLGPLAPFILEEPAFGPAHIGIFYAVFHLGGSSAAVFAGRVSDRWGSRPALLTLAGGLGIAVVMVSLSGSPLLMGIGLFVGGVAFSIASPATNKLLADQLTPGRNLSIALGVKQGGVPLASVLGGAVLTTGAVAVGWRASYGTIVLACLLLAALATRLRPHREDREERSSPRPTQYESPRLLVLAVFAFGMGAGMSQTTAYFSLFLVQTIDGVGPVAAGYTLSVAGFLGILARIVLAMIATAPQRHWWVLLVVSIGAAMTAGTLAGPIMLSPWMLVPVVLGLGAFVFGWSGVFQVVIVRASGARVGAGSGVAFTGFGLGLMIGPSAFAALLELTGRYQPSWLFVMACFAVSAISAGFIVFRDVLAARHI